MIEELLTLTTSVLPIGCSMTHLVVAYTLVQAAQQRHDVVRVKLQEKWDESF